jgi:hypothetical protein
MGIFQKTPEDLRVKLQDLWSFSVNTRGTIELKVYSSGKNRQLLATCTFSRQGADWMIEQLEKALAASQAMNPKQVDEDESVEK